MADNDIIKSFLVELGWKNDEQANKKFTETLRAATVEGNLLAAAFTKVAGSIFDNVKKISDNFELLFFQARRLRSSADDIRVVETAFQRNGVAIQETDAALTRFTDKLLGPGGQGFKNILKDRLGVTDFSSNAKSMLQAAEGIAKLPQQLQPVYMEMFGITRNMVDAAKESAEWAAKEAATRKSLGIDLQKQAKIMKELKEAWFDLSNIVSNFALVIIEKLNPAFESISNEMRKFAEYLEENKTQIMSWVDAIIAAFAKIDWGKLLNAWTFKEFVDAMGVDVTKLKTQFQTFANYMGGEFVKVITGAWRMIENAWSAFKTFFFGGPASAATGGYMGSMGGGTAGGGIGLGARAAAMNPQMLTGDAGEGATGGYDAPERRRKGKRGAMQRGGKGGVDYSGGGGGILGAGGKPTGNTAIDTSLPERARGLLDALSGPESGGSYTKLFGGGHFSNFAQHPGHAGQGGATDSGRYQFTQTTWRGVQQALGLPDFSPQSQDKGAWYLARRDYRANTGHDLLTDLNNNQFNPRGLQNTWVSIRNLGAEHWMQRYFNPNMRRALDHGKAGVAQLKDNMTTQEVNQWNAEHSQHVDHRAMFGHRTKNPFSGMPHEDIMRNFHQGPLGNHPALGANGPVTWNHSTHQNTINQNVKIQVDGATGPVDTAHEIGRHQKMVASAALRNLQQAAV